MKFEDLNDEEKKQVVDLMQRTVKGELFTHEILNKYSTNVVECFADSISKSLKRSKTNVP